MWVSYSSHTQAIQCLALCPVDIRNLSNSSGEGQEEGEEGAVSYPELARAIDSSLVMESRILPKQLGIALRRRDDSMCLEGL